MSRQDMSLFSMFVFRISLTKSPEILKCEGLIVVRCFAMLWGKVFILQIMGRRGMLSRCILPPLKTPIKT